MENLENALKIGGIEKISDLNKKSYIYTITGNSIKITDLLTKEILSNSSINPNHKILLENKNFEIFKINLNSKKLCLLINKKKGILFFFKKNKFFRILRNRKFISEKIFLVKGDIFFFNNGYLYLTKIIEINNEIKFIIRALETLTNFYIDVFYDEKKNNFIFLSEKHSFDIYRYINENIIFCNKIQFSEGFGFYSEIKNMVFLNEKIFFLIQDVNFNFYLVDENNKFFILPGKSESVDFSEKFGFFFFFKKNSFEIFEFKNDCFRSLGFFEFKKDFFISENDKEIISHEITFKENLISLKDKILYEKNVNIGKIKKTEN